MNEVVLVLQDGRPYRAFTDYDFAGDRMLEWQKKYPWFTWTIHNMSIDPTKAKIRSSTP